MNLVVPKGIKQDLELISKVWVELDDSTQTSGELVKQQVSKLHFERMEFASIFDHHWQNCSFVRYKVEYLDGTTKVFDFDNKESAKYFSPLEEATRACLRTNLISRYEDNVQGRRECLAEVDRLAFEKLTFPNTKRDSKTLIYYTLYFNTGYIELFDLSVQSLLSNSSVDFDILVITDEATKKIIEQTVSAKNKDLRYFVTESPVDGVDASKKKVDIFEYPQILDYSKVLFLDCDIVAQANIDSLLSLELKDGLLYTVKNKNLGYQHFKTVHHGFRCLSDEFVDEMRMAMQLPFNAGQYMFAPSPAILKHFENVRWFMDNWPSEYFFEQCFMCYYFCRGYLTDIVPLRKYIGLNSTTDNAIVDDDIEDKVLVHFIAPPLKASKKLQYIQDYLAKRKLKKPSLLGKLQGLFKRK